MLLYTRAVVILLDHVLDEMLKNQRQEMQVGKSELILAFWCRYSS